MNLPDGTQLDGYVIHSMLPQGRGGFACVYYATSASDPSISVAVKMSRADSHTSPEDHECFADVLNQEVEILQQLNHPRIVKIFPISIDGQRIRYITRALNIPGQPEYFVMEHLPGGSLKTLLEERGRLPLKTATEIAYQVASALEYMHLLGIAHRDLKPENVLFRRPPTLECIEPVLVDFGTAAKLHVMGTRAGSVLFMPPERIREVRGETAPEQSRDQSKVDVYGVGILLYRMLTGHLPFEGFVESRVTTAILHDPPTALRQYNPDIPEGVERLVLRCLDKAPERRPSIAELCMQLDRLSPAPRIIVDEQDVEILKPAKSSKERTPQKLLAQLGIGILILITLIETGILATNNFCRNTQPTVTPPVVSVPVSTTSTSISLTPSPSPSPTLTLVPLSSPKPTATLMVTTPKP